MTEPTPPAAISFAAPIPILRIFDEAKAREFYVDFLGFAVDWEHRFAPGAPLYCQVSLGACRLQLSEHFGDGTPGTIVKVATGGLAAYHAALLAKRYRHARPMLQDQDWGERQMTIADPFNNRLVFYEKLGP